MEHIPMHNEVNDVAHLCVFGTHFTVQSISKGRDVSSLYPHVAKLVVSPNTEIKKLVYAYLVHYAEIEPEAALLAINTLKKELGNTNQLARANALRTMSSIRVRIIAQLIAQAVKKAATDSSPYVRKTAAHAVTKLAEYALPPSSVFPSHLFSCFS
jgi:AP-3 complex subunit beta